MRNFFCPLMAVAVFFGISLDASAQDWSADREAINTLMWRYARALDTFDPDAYVAVYTEDGQFKSATTASSGRQALWQMIENFRKDREERAAVGNPAPPMYHMSTDTWIEFIDNTHARHHSYWLTIRGAVGGNPVVVASAGRGVDDLVKVNGQWLIRSRDIAPDN